MKTAIPTYLLILIVLTLPRGGAAAESRPIMSSQRLNVAPSKPDVSRRSGPLPLQRSLTVLPEVKFEEATLEQAVTFLSQKAHINIVIDPAVYASTAQPLTQVAPARQDKQPPSTTLPDPGETAAKTGKRASDDSTLITLHLKNVPLEVVLKYILRYKNLRYVVEDYAIVIVPIGRTLPEEMKTEIFRLRTGSLNVTRHPRPQAVRSF